MTADVLLAAYNFVVAVLWAGSIPRAPYAVSLSAAHGAAALLPALWALRQRRAGDESGSGFVGAVRQYYPLVLLAAFWSEMDLFRLSVHPVPYDGVVSQLDLAVFGTHLNAVLMPLLPERWVSEAMHLSYLAYYPLIIVPPIVLGLLGRRDALRDVVLRLLLTYLACYLVYLTFPADGPSYTTPHYGGTLTQGFFYRLSHAVTAAADTLGTGFPSSHVAGAVTMAWVGARWMSRPVVTLFVVEAAGVLVATVYTQNHFAIDALAGLALALVVQGLVAPGLQRWLAVSAPRRPSTIERTVIAASGVPC